MRQEATSASNKEQVRAFYAIIWNQHDKQAVPNLLTEDIVFRGSLGQEKVGHADFIEYLDSVHECLGDYRCVIEDLVAEVDKVFAKMLFEGIHRDVLMGEEPTGKSVFWRGAALSCFMDNKISRIWVLGDINSLESQSRKS